MEYAQTRLAQARGMHQGPLEERFGRTFTIWHIEAGWRAKRRDGTGDVIKAKDHRELAVMLTGSLPADIWALEGEEFREAYLQRLDVAMAAAREAVREREAARNRRVAR